MAQTPDGYLWAGTERGLTRFDGTTFQMVQPAGAGKPPFSNVLGLVADREGGLWVQLQRPFLLRYQDGRFQDPGIFGGSIPAVSSISRTWDGSLLLWILQGEASAVVLRNGKLETLATPANFSRSPVLCLAQTANGDLWAGTRDAGLFRITPHQTTRITNGLPDLKVNALALAGTDQLWIGTDAGVVRWDGTQLTSNGVPATLRGVQALALLVDRDTNLWVGTNSRGLARVNSGGVSWMDPQEDRAGAVTALLEDREGNLWAGTANGLERVRDTAFVTYSRTEGMPVERNGPLYADPQGRVWFAPTEGGLWWMRAGQRHQLTEAGLSGDVVYSITGGRDGVWVGRQRGGLTLLRAAGRPVTYTTRDGLAQNSVYSVYESRDGSVWAGTLSAGVSRLQNGRFVTYTNQDGLAANTVAGIAESPDGTLWFGTPAGLSAFARGAWRSYGTRDGLLSDDISCLLSDSAGVLWIGTANGLCYRMENRIRSFTGSPAALREPILGIAEDRKGFLWVSTAAHVIRVSREKFISGRLAGGDFREFGPADGLPASEGIKRSRSVIADASGRIWFSIRRGISVVDPGRLSDSSAPALVHVQSISADGEPVPLQDPVRIPGGRRRLTIDYTGLSLSVPERVRFRYMLESFDREWSASVAAREAVYTNLSPGHYRFRLVASNPDGVWNQKETTLSVIIEPLFWQTAWFRIAAVFALAAGIVLWYRARMLQLTRRLNLRFEERLAERTRIAQELHDTLLQGFLSVSMQVHVAADALPAESQAKTILSRALQRMGQVIEEGRNAVRGLRSPQSASLDLEHAFALVKQEIGPLEDDAATFRVIVDGEPRPLHPLLRDEVYRIGREALLNAFRHARADHIEIELKYAATQFRVFVRDDGVGIDPAIVQAGRDGHWGLSGMRERADRIGARFHVYTSSSAGTEIEIAVPGHIAFQNPARHTRTWFASRGRRK